MDVDKNELQKMVNEAVDAANAKRKAEEEVEILAQQEFNDLYSSILQACNYYNLPLNDEITKNFTSKIITLVKRGYHLQHPNWDSEKKNLIKVATDNQTR